ncbi:Cro/CI family transcriptional regulator [Bombella mellum]|uniref:Helix-turn-helix domain-containing protein n=1 Tax=Bombella mellum TaxID=2039288 RepID=A0ABR5ZRI2_9PROT|nr:hypothetical protein [Bombella mellum]
MSTKQIKEIVRKGGGPALVARHLGITPQAVCQWKRVPLSRIHDVSRLTKTPVSALLKLATRKPPTQRSAP